MSASKSAGTFKYRPGPVPTRGGGGYPRPKQPEWHGFDAHGAKAKMFPRMWRYDAGGRVERRDAGFEAFTRTEVSLGTFETLTAACIAVEKDTQR